MIRKNKPTLKDTKQAYKSKVILFLKLKTGHYSIKEKMMNSDNVRDFIDKNKDYIL
jgi:hypothetical protein